MLREEVGEFIRREPWCRSVDHPVAVGAKQDEILDFRLGLAGDVQWRPMVTLDVVGPARAIRTFEIEPARLAGHNTMTVPVRGYGLLAKRGIAFATEVQPLQYSTFLGTVAVKVEVSHIIRRRSSSVERFPDGDSFLLHVPWPR